MPISAVYSVPSLTERDINVVGHDLIQARAECARLRKELANERAEFVKARNVAERMALREAECEKECERLRADITTLRSSNLQFFLANDRLRAELADLSTRADKAERQAALNLEALNKERQIRAALQLRVGELEQELAEARKDTEWLDWIDAHGLPIAQPVDGSYKVGDIIGCCCRIAQLKSDDTGGMRWVTITIRAAIDAAMKKHR
jgi:hypothetical protein